ncbi:hypothetical protein [Nonomuraea aurantiaca]|uniref:hypothetical protein n=1 Tax=Nonomuraea aurantiaca TaxID=2878562 RepID=UPI001CD934B9|nr:hypothetical protein [Nonomuraea aurantiaca]MCA2223520.1 hypothetical protein [Nonomuraea aurantiaca]
MAAALAGVRRRYLRTRLLDLAHNALGPAVLSGDVRLFRQRQRVVTAVLRGSDVDQPYLIGRDTGQQSDLLAQAPDFSSRSRAA